MLYVEQVNASLQEQLSATGKAVVYGQNVAAGSRVGGLARNLADVPGCTVLNTPNAENALVGMGIGLALAGTPACFIMKQLDFSFLGIDQLLNTVAALRERSSDIRVPFVLLTVVVDSGFEGPQASANCLAPLAALLRVPVLTPSTSESVDRALESAFRQPFSIVGVSQKLMRRECQGSEASYEPIAGWLAYPADPNHRAADVTICLGFTGHAVLERDLALGEDRSVDALISYNWDVGCINQVVDLVAGYGRVTIRDDSKVMPSPGAALATVIASRTPECDITVIDRRDTESWYRPAEDGVSR